MDILDLISGFDILGAGIVVISILKVIAQLVLYVCQSVGIYLLALRTKQKNPWMAFVPVLQNMKLFNMAGLSSKVYVLFYCLYRAMLSAKLEWDIMMPIVWVGFAFFAIGLLYARYQMAKNFGCSQLVCILNALFAPFVMLYIVYKKNAHQYTPQYAKVDTYLKAYGLYEDPMTFEDPNAKPEPTFGKKQNAQNGQNQQPQQVTENQNWYQANNDANYQNPTPIQINVEKDENPINLNIDK